VTLATHHHLRMRGAIPQLPTTSLYAYGNRLGLCLIKNTDNFTLAFKFLYEIDVHCKLA